MLTQRQIVSFHKDGFLVVEGLLRPTVISDLRDWVQDIETTSYPPNAVLKYYEDSVMESGQRLLRRAENFCPYHAELYSFTGSNSIMEPIGALFGGTGVLFKDKINYKYPGGEGYYRHRDGRWWWRDKQGRLMKGWEVYASEFITAFVCIDDADLDNGCMELVSGKHLRKDLGDDFGPLTPEEANSMDFRCYPTQAGDAIFFSALTPHGSGPNLSDKPRRALYLTYNRRSEGDHRLQYFHDKQHSSATESEKSVSIPPSLKRNAWRL